MNRAFTIIELAIVICILALLTAIAVPNFLEAQQRADIAGVKEDQKRVSMALATYKLDYANYPFHWPFTASAGYVAATGVTNNINKVMAQAAALPTLDTENVASFATSQANTTALGLTTPVAYLTDYVKDRFASLHTSTFGFAACPKEYLLWSAGPDGTNQADGSDSNSNINGAEHIVRGGQTLPSPYLIAGPSGVQPAPPAAPLGGPAYTYDPTNGTASTGDIWRVANGAS